MKHGTELHTRLWQPHICTQKALIVHWPSCEQGLCQHSQHSKRRRGSQAKSSWRSDRRWFHLCRSWTRSRSRGRPWDQQCLRRPDSRWTPPDLDLRSSSGSCAKRRTVTHVACIRGNKQDLIASDSFNNEGGYNSFICLISGSTSKTWFPNKDHKERLQSTWAQLFFRKEFLGVNSPMATSYVQVGHLKPAWQ